ncbi:hypothetical protein DPEC_G00232830 [Dallia pectoralis]|uniref:Uncharacterized protein n=1 Tax=Dallia pectoralis TaxID=75939 RepID=A0ACC2FXF2_DALPE|nr:hypothetical protein DPEC_G00232830 [Dallia pectoralis]
MRGKTALVLHPLQLISCRALMKVSDAARRTTLKGKREHSSRSHLLKRLFSRKIGDTIGNVHEQVTD